MKSIKYDREFKLNCIKHYSESQKSMSQIRKDLATPISTFATQLKQFTENGEESFPGSGKLKPYHEEIDQIKK